MYKIYGNNDMQGAPSENAEQATFFNSLRVEFPDLFAVAVHIPNEGKRTKQQIDAIKVRGGYVKGASDIIIPGSPTLLIELKSRDKKSNIRKEQIEYLESASRIGATCCVCYGYEAALEAVREWRSRSN